MKSLQELQAEYAKLQDLQIDLEKRLGKCIAERKQVVVLLAEVNQERLNAL